MKRNIMKKVMYFMFLDKNKHKHTQICLLKAYTMSSWRYLSKVSFVSNRKELKCAFLSIK